MISAESMMKPYRSMKESKEKERNHGKSRDNEPEYLGLNRFTPVVFR